MAILHSPSVINSAQSVVVTDATRSITVYDAGILIFTSDTKMLYAGDGATAGGIFVAGNDAPVALSASGFEGFKSLDATFVETISAHPYPELTPTTVP